MSEAWLEAQFLTPSPETIGQMSGAHDLLQHPLPKDRSTVHIIIL